MQVALLYLFFILWFLCIVFFFKCSNTIIGLKTGAHVTKTAAKPKK